MSKNPHKETDLRQLRVAYPALAPVFENDPDLAALFKGRHFVLNIFDGGSIAANSILSASSVLLGQSGSGKTNGLAALLEELANVGASFSCIDSEGDLYTVADILKSVKVIEVKNAWHEEDIYALALSTIQGIERNIFTFTATTTIEERRRFVLNYSKSLFEIADARYREGKAMPHLLVIDEAHLYAAQQYSSADKWMQELLFLFGNIASMGRKRGLGLLMATTRAARLNKDILSQVRMRWLMRAVEPADIKSYRAALNSIDDPNVQWNIIASIPTLPIGCAIFVPDDGQGRPIKFRMRYSRHISTTPTMENYEKYGEKEV
ncbi:MAG: DUF853 family protein [Candidatus Burarchaeum sp.]|nr:DUF87 domain-containing protein [Candidatus Burarchaeum sp.]MDO8339900.1 DUF853 family protein [Candidatus Burarchaeum sp.]